MSIEVRNATKHSNPYQGCPHFGLKGDPDTGLMFPSSVGSCYRAEPPASVEIGHQQRCCLTAEHTTCPVFMRPEPGPLPLELQGATAKAFGRRWTWQRIASVIGVLFLSAVLVGWGVLMAGEESDGIAGAPPVQATATAQDAAAVVITATATVTPTAVPTETAIPTETATAAPVDTPTGTPTLPRPPSATPEPTALPEATFTPTAVPNPIAVVNLTPLNVRRGPDVAYPALEQVSETGVEVEVIGQNEAGDWLQICCVAEQSGWITAESVTVTGDTAVTPIIPPPLPQAAVNVVRLNIRSGPGVDFPVITQVDEGEVYDLTGRLSDNSWWELCCFDGASGWAIGEAISVLGIGELAPVLSPALTPEQ